MDLGQDQQPYCAVCIVGELAGEGSMALAVCVSDMWHVTGNTWHLTPDTCHLTPDPWHLTRDTWYVTPDIWHIFSFFVCIGASNRTHRVIQWLPYAGFLSTFPFCLQRSLWPRDEWSHFLLTPAVGGQHRAELKRHWSLQRKKVEKGMS